jgi:hypothetical protein
MNKTCFKCGKEKDINEFYKHPKMGDGHLGKCKNCTKQDVHDNYNLKFEKYREYERNRTQGPERKKQNLEWLRKMRATKPHIYHAYMCVSKALKSGKLKRGPCEVCGVIDVQAHHDDYNKPLDIRWLCFVHHRELHRHHNVSRGRGPF